MKYNDTEKLIIEKKDIEVATKMVYDSKLPLGQKHYLLLFINEVKNLINK
jgi:beta-galactosidase beta subunit